MRTSYVSLPVAVCAIALIGCENVTRGPTAEISKKPDLTSEEAVSAAIRGRPLVAGMDTSRLAGILDKVPIEHRLAVAELFIDDGLHPGLRTWQLEANGTMLADSRLPARRGNEARATAVASIDRAWRKPILLRQVDSNNVTSVVVHLAGGPEPDVISLASDEQTVEYLAVAMQAIGRLRNRASATKKQTLTAEIRSPVRGPLPQSWRNFLQAQLDRLGSAQSRSVFVEVLPAA